LTYAGPILDNHFHVQPAKGRGLDAVRDFLAAGGTHVTLIPIPGEADKTTKSEWRAFFEAHLQLCDLLERETTVKVIRALGPYPIEFVRMAKTDGIGKASEAFRAGYDAAYDLLVEGNAVVMGEVGRPHFEVPTDVWDESNRLLEYGLGRAREAQAPVILHTEHAPPPVFADLARIAKLANFPLERLVKHYSPPAVKPEENHGLFPSIIASKSNIAEAIAKGDRFMMETDYIDDLSRPNVVLPPHSVPKRTKALAQQGVTHDSLLRIHQEHPERIFRVRVRLDGPVARA
jgi:TatD-related deoxyribonuclease